jgi:hypothetical protein
LFSFKQDIVMANANQKKQLTEIVIQLNNADKYEDTGYTANKAMQLIESAITIINQIHIKSKEKNQIKKNTLTNLKIACKNAEKYYMTLHGFDPKIFRNDKVLPCMYINKAYDSLEYFIHKVFI